MFYDRKHGLNNKPLNEAIPVFTKVRCHCYAHKSGFCIWSQSRIEPQAHILAREELFLGWKQDY